jgi:hypothetical protein
MYALDVEHVSPLNRLTDVGALRCENNQLPALGSGPTPNADMAYKKDFIDLDQ